LNLYSDAAEDNSDKWRVQVADGGDVTLETYQSGAWVAVGTWSNAGGFTATGTIAGGTLTEGGNAVPNATDKLSFFAATTSAELAGVLSDETGNGGGFVRAENATLVAPTLGVATATTLNTGQGDYELYAMNQDTETTDSPTFVTAKLSGLADGYIPYHVADATGLADSVISQSGGNISIAGGKKVKKTNKADENYSTSALTSDYLIAWTSLTAARTATISTEDIESGTTTQPRMLIFKDESGNAGTHNITITLENGGTIDGAASFVINQPYMSVPIYLNGTNGFVAF
jgi:hypothetical protein